MCTEANQIPVNDKDILSSIVRLNMSTDNQALSMEQMLEQIPTFLVAGTSSLGRHIGICILTPCDRSRNDSKHIGLGPLLALL